MTTRAKIRRRWKILAVAVLGILLFLYLLGYYLGPDKQWRGPNGKPVGEER